MCKTHGTSGLRGIWLPDGRVIHCSTEVNARQAFAALLRIRKWEPIIVLFIFFVCSS